MNIIAIRRAALLLPLAVTVLPVLADEKTLIVSATPQALSDLDTPAAVSVRRHSMSRYRTVLS